MRHGVISQCSAPAKAPIQSNLSESDNASGWWHNLSMKSMTPPTQQKRGTWSPNFPMLLALCFRIDAILDLQKDILQQIVLLHTNQRTKMFHCNA